MKYWGFFLFFTLIAFSCKTKKTTLDTPAKVMERAVVVPDPVRQSLLRCNQAEEYAPDPDYPLLHPQRELKLVFHMMNSSSGEHNFKGERAISEFTKLVDAANDRLGKNEKLNLPEGNDYPVLDPGFRYKLLKSVGDRGFLFHNDDELYYFINKGANRNNYTRDVIRKYAVNPDSIINVFIMPHHPDSMASPSYPGFGSGIALGTSLKMAGIYENNGNPAGFATIFNHEVGHILGLQHAWLKNDGCLDTPEHPNCYGPSKDPPCDGAISNNMMDYNFAQIALSPCQIGRIHKNFSRPNSKQRKLIEADWCKYKEDQKIIIKDSIVWKRAFDLESDLIVEKGGVLTVTCRLSIPKGGKIIVRPGGKLILDGAEIHNACGEIWGGIEIQSKRDKRGEIEIRNESSINDLKGDEENSKP